MARQAEADETATARLPADGGEESKEELLQTGGRLRRRQRGEAEL